MNKQKLRRTPPQELAVAAAGYQREAVIPHCPTCAAPCCKLDKLVLELEWAQLKGLWQLEESRKAFDKRLATGRGPIEIRPANGLYYAHSKPCPAFDAACGCTVYTTPLKPVGCSDFPVYENEGEIMADLRCEAVDLEALKAALTRDLGPDTRIKQSADRDFPFLVTLSVQR
ncbi:hypothetical protein [Uliginosibacterium sp. TH139]|uniref:hypothetical protein n=1 Tax=Uliginosibacterium sp. TH139 TaxID=2067453 RepID=UPI000C7DBECA|nr:hypothetical protein [Uliginosibacterium sp. TH139]PLK50307.1 hypothetical protein C0V76_00290 [Uliginosibacterium sp. TH139]